MQTFRDPCRENKEDYPENVVEAVRQIAIAAILLGGFGVQAEGQAKPAYQDVADHHLLPRVDWIRTPPSSGRMSFRGLTLQVGVDRNGAVTSASVAEGPNEYREAALRLARVWKYRPFVLNGKAQPVVIRESVSLLPPERPARIDIMFPVVHDWNRVKITLKRTMCFGECPDYVIQILGGGDVAFEARLPTPMKRQGKVSHQDLESLIAAFRAAHFYGLEWEYRLNASDLPSTIMSITIDGKMMSVTDYGGLQVGMPVAVRDLGFAIDQVVGSSQWLWGR
jgi:hypothetical protein